jgi:hypothetical protein
VSQNESEHVGSFFSRSRTCIWLFARSRRGFPVDSLDGPQPLKQSATQRQHPCPLRVLGTLATIVTTALLQPVSQHFISDPVALFASSFFAQALTATVIQLLPISLYKCHDRSCSSKYGYRRVNSGQASSCHSEPKGWGPLRLYHITHCILHCTSIDSGSTGTAPADLITQLCCHSSTACIQSSVTHSSQQHLIPASQLEMCASQLEMCACMRAALDAAQMHSRQNVRGLEEKISP